MEIRESKREENKRVRRKLKRVGEKGGGRAGPGDSRGSWELQGRGSKDVNDL